MTVSLVTVCARLRAKPGGPAKSSMKTSVDDDGASVAETASTVSGSKVVFGKNDR